MTGTQLAALIRYKTRTNTTTFTDADMLPLVNIFKDEIASLILEKNSKYFLIPSTFDLVANQREYSFDDTLLNRINKLEIKFSANDSRFPATAIKNYDGSETESEIVKNFSNSPGGFAYTIRRRGIFLLSGTISNVTAGGRLLWYKYPADLANLSGVTNLETDPSTTTFGLMKGFHELWARRVGMEYKSRQPKPIPFSKLENNYEVDLQRQLDAISTVDESLEIIGELPPASQIGNNGWNF